MGAVRPQTPYRSPRQAFGGNPGVPACGRRKTTRINFLLCMTTCLKLAESAYTSLNTRFVDFLEESPRGPSRNYDLFDSEHALEPPSAPAQYSVRLRISRTKTIRAPFFLS